MTAPTQQQQSQQFWWQYPVTRKFEGQWKGAERGVDLGAPFHTPVQELWGGTVTQAGYYDWGGEVDIQTQVPGLGNFTESYVHLDYIEPGIQAGTVVQPWQQIGLTGGENAGYPGALHPANPYYSSYPHIEYDLFEGRPWTSTSIDPYPYITNGPLGQNTGNNANTNTGNNGIIPTPGSVGNDIQNAITGVWNSIVTSFGMTGTSDFLWRVALIAAGLGMITMGLLMFSFGAVRQAAPEIIETAAAG